MHLCRDDTELVNVTWMGLNPPWGGESSKERKANGGNKLVRFKHSHTFTQETNGFPPNSRRVGLGAASIGTQQKIIPE